MGRACFALISLAFVATAAYAAHGNWQDHYTDEHGVRCCGAYDCPPAVVQVLYMGEHQADVRINGVPVSLHPLAVHESETQTGHVCLRDPEGWLSRRNIRCVFYVVGG